MLYNILPNVALAKVNIAQNFIATKKERTDFYLQTLPAKFWTNKKPQTYCGFFWCGLPGLGVAIFVLGDLLFANPPLSLVCLSPHRLYNLWGTPTFSPKILSYFREPYAFWVLVPLKAY